MDFRADNLAGDFAGFVAGECMNAKAKNVPVITLGSFPGGAKGQVLEQYPSLEAMLSDGDARAALISKLEALAADAKSEPEVLPVRRVVACHARLLLIADLEEGEEKQRNYLRGVLSAVQNRWGFKFSHLAAEQTTIESLTEHTDKYAPIARMAFSNDTALTALGIRLLPTLEDQLADSASVAKIQQALEEALG